MVTAPATVHETALRSLPLIHRGKVRDVYAVDERHLLIVTTDRLSAFDVVLPDPIPGKGCVLHQISDFWFDQTAALGFIKLWGLPVEVQARRQLHLDPASDNPLQLGEGN